MVQLNVTYDKKLKSKIFVLKSEEGYARTTDVVADLISDFDDCNTHFKYARVGLELDVLREIGKGFIYIYDNGNLIYEPIPWDSEHMSTIIDSDWNDKGVYWINNVLRIGTSDNTDSGLFIAYDVEHNIEVRFTGNEYCLGSKSDNIKFLMETPDLYVSELSLGFDSQYHHSNNIIGNIKYSATNIENDKVINIYDNDAYLKSITLTSTAVTSLSLGELSNGIHNIKAVFLGDDESTYIETSTILHVGYQIQPLISENDVFVYGANSAVSCEVRDYNNDPVSDVTVTGVNLVQGEYVPCSSSVTPNADFVAVIDDYKFKDAYNYLMAEFDVDGETYTYYTELNNRVVDVGDIKVTANPSNLITVLNAKKVALTGYAIYDNVQEFPIVMDNIPFVVDVDGVEYSVKTNDEGTFYISVGTRSYYDAGVVTVSCGDVSKTIQLVNLISYYNTDSNQAFGIDTTTGYVDLSKVSNGVQLWSPLVANSKFKFKTPSDLLDGKTYSVEFYINSVDASVFEVSGISSSLLQAHSVKMEVTSNIGGYSIQLWIDGAYVGSGTANSMFEFVLNGKVTINNFKMRYVRG